MAEPLFYKTITSCQEHLNGVRLRDKKDTNPYSRKRHHLIYTPTCLHFPQCNLNLSNFFYIASFTHEQILKTTSIDMFISASVGNICTHTLPTDCICIKENLLPEFDQIVAASRDKAFDIVWFLSRRLIDQAARNHSRCPTHCVTADLPDMYRRMNNRSKCNPTLNSRETKQNHLFLKLTVCALLIFLTSHC